MVIRIEEGWTMVQEAIGQARQFKIKKPMRSDSQHLNPVVSLTAELWFPGQRVRTEDETHAGQGKAVSAKKSSAVMAVLFSGSSGQSVSAPDADEHGGAGVVTETV